MKGSENKILWFSFSFVFISFSGSHLAIQFSFIHEYEEEEYRVIIKCVARTKFLVNTLKVKLK